MQVQAYDWPTAWVEITKQVVDLGKIIVPVIVTAIVSWKIARHQITIKTAEMDAQSKLRARELIFDVHRRQLEKHRDQADQTMGSFGSMHAHLQDFGKRRSN
jgi:hypothetical protein